MTRNGKECVSCIILQNLRSADYADSLSELFRTASHPGEMLSVRAFAQQLVVRGLIHVVRSSRRS
ncbi:hypothetical protein LR48_Vigan06g100900 [Vigna angularis]|uniref:Uncharacterized protein n=1 Tax=Phaseolus angularis TaxID=3914 RepID=A0A0L9USG9_PHAAN|nr:hypothetical protein LR48_Vigan06g100900 [Vigna angularis]